MPADLIQPPADAIRKMVGLPTPQKATVLKTRGTRIVGSRSVSRADSSRDVPDARVPFAPPDVLELGWAASASVGRASSGDGDDDSEDQPLLFGDLPALPEDPADWIPEEDAADEDWGPHPGSIEAGSYRRARPAMVLNNLLRTLHLKQANIRRRAPGVRSYQMRTRQYTPSKTRYAVSGTPRSTIPKLNWQHLAPGHYIAKARQGLTPGIRQHVLNLMRRAKGYVWINGKRLSVKRATTTLLRLLGTRASVDIKLTNDFPFKL